jgi:HNH endonuclease
MNLKEAGKLAKSHHVEQAVQLLSANGLDWLLETTGRDTPKFRYTVVDGDRVPTKAFGFLVAQLAGKTSSRSNDMTVNEAAAVLKRAAGAVSLIPGAKTETAVERTARLDSYYKQLARPGQAMFREQLMRASDGVCAISGCDVPSALEAAHIDPFSQSRCDDMVNGILLRADLHRMFDANHLAVEPSTGRVCIITPYVSHYASLNGITINIPTEGPKLSAFASRWEAFDGV